jgi:FkbM family methyltransferase
MIKRRIKQIVRFRETLDKFRKPEERTRLLFKLFTEMYSGISFRGQLDQDLIAYLYFKGKTDGFYLDIGAHDGISINNTFVFEQLGWRGVCIEPLPDIFQQLKQNRKCDCYNAAIYDLAGTDSIDFVKADGLEMFSGINECMTKTHKRTIISSNAKLEYIKVKVLTFNSLMSNYPNITHIDFLSMDVEGAEMRVLKSIDFNKYSFGLLCVENNEENIGDGEKIIKVMQENGYAVLFDYKWDIFFAPIKKNS